MYFKNHAFHLITIILFFKRCLFFSIQNITWIGSDADVGGILSEEDYENSENESIISATDKAHYSENGLFEGDIIRDERLGEAINIAQRKWPKSDDGFVDVPISFPSFASKEEKAAIARVITEFKNNTCIRYKFIFTLSFIMDFNLMV